MMDFWIDDLKTAFSSVKANRGCAGVDGITIAQFEKRLRHHLEAIAFELESGAYRPLPLLKILVAKKNGEPRALCIPAVRDRVAQKALLMRLEPCLEKEFEECSYAYRKGRSVRQAVMRIKALYEDGFRWVVDADIDAFFDNVDHGLLMEKVRGVVPKRDTLELIERWLKAEVWDGAKLSPLDRGIPQGSALSPILANLFLDELDEAMLAEGFQYIRYADDFIVLCKTPERANQVLSFSKEILDDLLLELDEEEVTHFERGFHYLGVFFINSLIMKPFESRKRQRKILYYPPPMDLEAYLLKKRKGW
jgi:group II intron reverse transcriptase/maturase